MNNIHLCILKVSLHVVVGVLMDPAALEISKNTSYSLFGSTSLRGTLNITVPFTKSE